MFKYKNMISKTTALILVSAVTVACLGDEVTRAGIDKQSQIQISHVSFDHLVMVDSSSGMVGSAGMERLDGFLRGISPKFGDKFVITGGTSAARSELAKHLKPLMLPVREMTDTDGALQIAVQRTIVSVPSCGDWSYEKNPLNGNDQNRNFSCATDTNLARMLADPNDLVTGRTPSDTMAGSDMIAVQAYREGTVVLEGGSVRISDLARKGKSEDAGSGGTLPPTGSGGANGGQAQ